MQRPDTRLAAIDPALSADLTTLLRAEHSGILRRAARHTRAWQVVRLAPIIFATAMTLTCLAVLIVGPTLWWATAAGALASYLFNAGARKGARSSTRARNQIAQLASAECHADIDIVDVTRHTVTVKVRWRPVTQTTKAAA